MADTINIQTISESPTTLKDLTSVTILNGNSTEIITITVSGEEENLILDSGQTLTFNAPMGATLPDLTLIGDVLTANVVSY